MQGLLDDPARVGLLATGLGLMGARGRLGPALGNAGLTGLGMFQQAMQDAQRRKLQELQMQSVQQNLAAQQAERERRAQLEKLPQQFATSNNPAEILSGGTPNKADVDYAGLSNAYAGQGEFGLASAVRQFAAPPKRNLTSVAPGASLVDEATGQPVYTAPPKQDEDEFVGALRAAGIDPASPQGRQLLAQRLTKMTTHAPAATAISYGAPVPVQLPGGGVGYVQPGNRPGAPPQLMQHDGTPLLRPPTEAETKRAAEQEEKKKGAKEAVDLLAQAEKIIPKATGSAVGSAYDTAAGWVGHSPSGAQAAGQLKTIQGALIAKMPRMEGPQSNHDVRLYIESAGAIGDPNIPRETKLAAIKTIREIQHRYSGGAPASSGTYSDPAKERRYQEWKAKQK